jgi:hypothetical protein
MTLDEFSNGLRRIHWIDGWELALLDERRRKFVAAPVDFFLRSDDETRAEIWRAMALVPGTNVTLSPGDNVEETS